MTETSLFHPGERHMQLLAGVSASSAITGKSVARTIVPGAWSFLAAQSMIIIGSWDGQRGAWPSMVLGAPGFVSTKDGSIVILDMRAGYTDASDPLWTNLQLNEKISLLAIELSTRRRLRINGYIAELPQTTLAKSRFEITVEQAYPNCPKYIQRRRQNELDTCNTANKPPHESAALDTSQRELIASADTFFVASVGPNHDTDVSHRGGNPGFVDVISQTLLRIPDYPGNNMFNTLGNIYATGFAGLLFVDFTTGQQLQITGNAKVEYHTANAHAQRTWSLEIVRVRESFLPPNARWSLVDASPFNPPVLHSEHDAQT